MLRIAVRTVVNVAPFAKIGVNTGAGKLIVGPDRLNQSCGVDADLAGKLLHRVRDLEVAAIDALFGNTGSGWSYR